jgi:hypothetical protein
VRDRHRVLIVGLGAAATVAQIRVPQQAEQWRRCLQPRRARLEEHLPALLDRRGRGHPRIVQLTEARDHAEQLSISDHTVGDDEPGDHARGVDQHVAAHVVAAQAGVTRELLQQRRERGDEALDSTRELSGRCHLPPYHLVTPARDRCRRHRDPPRSRGMFYRPNTAPHAGAEHCSMAP